MFLSCNNFLCNLDHFAERFGVSRFQLGPSGRSWWDRLMFRSSFSVKVPWILPLCSAAGKSFTAAESNKQASLQQEFTWNMWNLSAGPKPRNIDSHEPWVYATTWSGFCKGFTFWTVFPLLVSSVSVCLTESHLYFNGPTHWIREKPILCEKHTEPLELPCSLNQFHMTALQLRAVQMLISCPPPPPQHSLTGARIIVHHLALLAVCRAKLEEAMRHESD